MSLSRFSIQRPVFAWILMFALIFFGILSFRQMGINENPDVDYPNIRINYFYEGATPAVIEKDVIEAVESVLVSIEGIRNMTSTSSRSTGSIELEFEINRDIDFALQEVQTLLGRAQRQLPAAVEPPVVTKSNAADDPVMYLNLRTESLSDRELMILFRDQIQDRLSTIEGVAEIRAFGYHEPVLRVDLRIEDLKKYDLTPMDIVDSIQREHKELPAGRLEFGPKEDTIRIMGELSQLKDFENLIISRRGGAPNFVPLRLKDVANLYEGVENLRRISRLNGIKALGMAVQKQRGVNTVAVADRVFERIDEINKNLPEETVLGVNFDRSQFIRESVNELVFTLFLSAFLTSIVCWLFLGSLSATLNIVLAIPTAIIGTFIVINWLGFTLNTFSLLGLALAIGVVVDDAIIMLENIVRYMQMGWDRLNASYKGSREITFAVLATSLALISIFFPIGFMPGIEGKFFLEFSVTIAIAVSLSSLEALTLAPMRCSQFLKIPNRTSVFGKAFERLMNWLRDLYESSLEKALKYKKTVVAGSSAVFLSSLLLFPYLPSEFAPAQDRSVLFVIFLAPDGSSLEYTQEKVIAFENIVKQHPAVERQYMAVGGFGQGGQSNRGNGVIILKNPKNRNQNQFEVAAELREKAKELNGLSVFIRDRFESAIGGRRGSPIEFTINGPDPKVQKQIFTEIQSEMQKIGYFEGIRSDDVLSLPEVHILPDRKKAIERGVEISEIADNINVAFGGVAAAQYTDQSRRFDIFVQLKKEDRAQKTDIESVQVRNNRGELISLSDVVRVEETRGPQSIYRENRLRGIRVDSNLATSATQGEAIGFIQDYSKKLPDSYFFAFQETPQEKIKEAIWIMILGLLIAYMILAIQFNSFLDPIIVFVAVPFGLSGACVALLLGGQTINIYSIIGILLTLGIAKKNSILLIEFTNQLRDQGRDISTALKEACPTRLRPILMTSIATLAAALPAAFAFGPGSETRIPMALTVLGGVSLSSLFTLYVVPCVYSLLKPKRIQIAEESKSQS